MKSKILTRTFLLSLMLAGSSAIAMDAGDLGEKQGHVAKTAVKPNSTLSQKDLKLIERMKKGLVPEATPREIKESKQAE